ncbi:hypothetical protein N9W34_01370 [Rickettsiales bacterium]|nr:hypothetical protein [Rickettsiales bacterium]
MKRSYILPLIIFSIASIANAADKTSITIYSKSSPGSINPQSYRPTPGRTANYNIPGYAIVKEIRQISLPKRDSEVKFSDVAAYIDPTTVSFKSLTDPRGTSVLEQNYHFDLVNREKLLQKYIGSQIEVEQIQGSDIEKISGKLLSSYGGITLENDSGNVIVLSNYANLKFPSLPGGLITKPTLIWDVQTGKTGIHDIEVSYQTDGVSWWADYNGTFSNGNDENSGYLDLGAWVSILNKSGTTYNNAKLKLIAGEVNRVQQNQVQQMDYMRKSEGIMAAQAGFTEKSFFEFHLYTLGKNTTIPDNSTKQVELFNKVTNIPVRKKYIYQASTARFYGVSNYHKSYGSDSGSNVEVYLEFKNDSRYNLGMPLPAGRLRINKIDSDDDSLEFIGEDVIGHTPKDEDIKIKLGKAFDILGSRKQLSFKTDKQNRVTEETIEITLRSHKESPVSINVIENLYRGPNWKISNATISHKEIDANIIEYVVNLQADQEKKIRYTVTYNW